MTVSKRTLAAIACLSVSLVGQETPDRWRFSGFGSLGLASSSTGDAEYSRELSQPRGITTTLDTRLDTRLGLQVNVNLTDDLSFVGQVISKYRFDHTFTPDLSWAFLSYTPSSGLQLRAGRLGWDVFQLADTRNVGYSYLWARPPVDFYGPLQISSMDGGDIAWTTPIGEGQSLRFKFSAGQTWEKIPTSAPGEYLEFNGGRLLGALAEFQGEKLNFRVAYARYRPANDLPSRLVQLREGIYSFATALNDPGLLRQADALHFQNQIYSYYTAGLNWQDGPFRLDAVAAQVYSRSGLIPSLKSGYVSAGYRLHQLVPYLVVSKITTNPAAPYVGALPGLGPQGAALAGGIRLFVEGANADQRTLALGLRWDFHPKAALKMQVDHISSDPDAVMLLKKARPGWDGTSTIATVVLDFVF